jgi:palmitoyltransferase
VFGDNRWLWFLPVFTSFGDGITFPQRGQLDEEAGLLGQSPPTTQFPSAESMPMLRQGLANGGVSDDDTWDSRPKRQASSSTTSSSENEAARLNGGNLAVSTPLRQQREDSTLVTVSM